MNPSLCLPFIYCKWEKGYIDTGYIINVENFEPYILNKIFLLTFGRHPSGSGRTFTLVRYICMDFVL